MAKKRILIIEDDAALCEILTYNLELAGYTVSAAPNGPDGLRQAHQVRYDLIILDIMLPGLDGIEVCRRLRSSSATRDVLILMVTAKSEEIDQLVGFSGGGDDYVTKPFSVKVLLQRIKTLLRRQGTNREDRDRISSQGITIDRKSFQAMANDEVLPLTKSEFALLDTLIRNPGRAFNRAQLIDSALGGDAIVLERTIDVHIRALRKKLGHHARLIETIRGIGYRFDHPRD